MYDSAILKNQPLLAGPNGVKRNHSISPAEKARLSAILRSRSISSLAFSITAILWAVAAIFTMRAILPNVVALYTALGLGFLVASGSVLTKSFTFPANVDRDKSIIVSMQKTFVIEVAVGFAVTILAVVIKHPALIAGSWALIFGIALLLLSQNLKLQVAMIPSILMLLTGAIGVWAAIAGSPIYIVSPTVASSMAIFLWLSSAAMIAMALHALRLMTVSRRRAVQQ